MAEVFAQFDAPIVGSDGLVYTAQACGSPTADGLWEGWIEFVPEHRAVPIRSARETTQPNRTDALYWASGLTKIYLEGALERALTPLAPRNTRRPRPAFQAPARDSSETFNLRTAGHHPVLDPFSVHHKSETLLRQELGALSAWQLVNIVLAHGLSGGSVAMLNRLPTSALIKMIIAGVREHTLGR